MTDVINDIDLKKVKAFADAASELLDVLDRILPEDLLKRISNAVAAGGRMAISMTVGEDGGPPDIGFDLVGADGARIRLYTFTSEAPPQH